VRVTSGSPREAWVFSDAAFSGPTDWKNYKGIDLGRNEPNQALRRKAHASLENVQRGYPFSFFDALRIDALTHLLNTDH
jgi:hypothetical protein